MNQNQRKFLRERIEKAEREHNRKLYKDRPLTPEVRKAKAIVKKWDDEESAIESALREKVREARIAAHEALFFEDPAAALKAVKAFESMKFRK